MPPKDRELQQLVLSLLIMLKMCFSVALWYCHYYICHSKQKIKFKWICARNVNAFWKTPNLINWTMLNFSSKVFRISSLARVSSLRNCNCYLSSISFKKGNISTKHQTLSKLCLHLLVKSIQLACVSNELSMGHQFSRYIPPNSDYEISNKFKK